MAERFARPNVALGEVIRRHRDTLGLSQQRLGEAAGISTNALSSIENGHAGANVATLDRVANALGKSAAYLLSLRDIALEAQAAGKGGPRVEVTKAIGEDADVLLAAEPGVREKPEAPPDPSDAEAIISWIADGLLYGYRFDIVAMVGSDGTPYPLPTESASMANMLETTLVRHLEEAAQGYDGVEVELPRNDRVYPDIAFKGPALDGQVVACDIKVARRNPANRSRTKSRITLYTGNTYFKDPENTRNIQRSFDEYALHLDCVALYDFVEEPKPAVTNVELIVVEPWRIGSKSRSSMTRSYIGAIMDIPAIKAGRGEFPTKEEFYAYWRAYAW